MDTESDVSGDIHTEGTHANDESRVGFVDALFSLSALF
jgi:hypothetical protein